MRRPRLPSTDDARSRRRRLKLLAIVLAAVAGLTLALSIGSSGQPTAFELGDGPAPTLLQPTVAKHRGGRPGGARPGARFAPSPAVVRLAASLPLEQQVAELFIVALQPGLAPPESSIAQTGWGGLVIGASNFESDSQLGRLAAQASSAIRAAGGLAPLIAAHQEGGQTSAFRDLPPEGEATIGASGDPRLARAQAMLAAARLRSLGLNMTLAPVADVDTPGGALSGRLYSTDPAMVAALSDAAVTGYNAGGIVSAAGHFPGSGAASADPDQMTATVGGTLSQLRRRDLVPFAALAPHAPVIMMSNAVYAAFDGVTPAGLLGPAVQLLRHRYGFEGVIMSDDLDAALQATGADAGAAALAALQAGDSLLFISGSPAEQHAAYAAVLGAAQRSAAVRKRVHDALLRVLTLKQLFGILSG